MYWGYDATHGRFRTYFFNDQGPFDAMLSTYEGVVEQRQLTFTGPARFRSPLDDDGRVARDNDGTINTDWFLRDAGGDWKPWRQHRYSPL
jgi:hypothetical protein